MPDMLPAIGGEAVETHEPCKNTKCLQDELRHYALPDQGHTECPPGEPLSAEPCKPLWALPRFSRSLVISCDYASFCKSSHGRWRSLGHYFRDKQATTRDLNLFGLEFLETDANYKVVVAGLIPYRDPFQQGLQEKWILSQLQRVVQTEFGSNRVFGHIKPVPHSGAGVESKSKVDQAARKVKKHEQHASDGICPTKPLIVKRWQTPHLGSVAPAVGG